MPSDHSVGPQIISAGAIIGTLIYAIMQIKANNHLARIRLTFDTLQVMHEFNREIGLDNGAARVWRKGLRNDGDLDADEKTQFNLMVASVFNGFECHVLLEQEGLIDPIVWGDRQMQFMLSRPGVRQWWPKNRDIFNPQFRDYTDAALSALQQTEQNQTHMAASDD